MAKLDDLLNDGVLFYGTIVTERDSQRKVTGTKFNSLGHLFFNWSSINQRFDEWNVGNLSEVSLKVKTYFNQEIHQSHKVQIEQALYEIITIDPTNDKRYVYLFLKKVGMLDDLSSIK